MEYNLSFIKAKMQQALQKKTSGETSNDRLPAGQFLTQQFPILDLGIHPQKTLQEIKIKVYGEVEKELIIDSALLLSLPSVEITRDFHCVTRWSKFDVNWTGVLISEIAKLTKPTSDAKFIIFESDDKYTTNVPLSDALEKDCSVVYKLEQKEIPINHGGPVRALIPHLYGWKSAKFLNAIKFTKHDELGFWETRGYHAHGDPWKEERYS